MKQNFKKKAFTLVELLVVIAIVAVLASVSIVGYMHFIDKAHTSNDVTLVKQLNTMLSASYVNEGNNKTMRDAVEDITEGGITVDQLKSESNEILWDQDSDRFLVSNGTKIVYKDNETSDSITSTPYKLWKVYDEIPETQNYSIYLNKKEKVVSLFAEPKVDFTLTTGFDAGNDLTAYNLTYAGLAASEPGTIINLSGGTLIINDSKADIEFRGTIDDLVISNTSRNLIKFFGNATSVELTKGYLSLEKGSIIEKLSIFASDLDENSDSNLVINAGFNGFKEINYTNESILSKLQTLLSNSNIDTTLKLIIDPNSIFKLKAISNGRGLHSNLYLVTNLPLEYKYELVMTAEGISSIGKKYNAISIIRSQGGNFEVKDTNFSKGELITSIINDKYSWFKDPFTNKLTANYTDSYGTLHTDERIDFIFSNSSNKLSVIIDESPFKYICNNLKIEVNVYKNDYIIEEKIGSKIIVNQQ